MKVCPGHGIVEILRPRGTEFEEIVKVDSNGRDSSSGEGVSTMSGGFNMFGRGGEGVLRCREDGNGARAPPSTEDSN